MDAQPWKVEWDEEAVSWLARDPQGISYDADTRSHAMLIAADYASRPLTWTWNGDFTEGVGR